MTREEFIKILGKKGYSYEIGGDKIVVTYKGDVNLRSLVSLPPDVSFENGGHIDLESITSLPPGLEFKNGGHVYLGSLTGDFFIKWEGNIEGIDSKRLLNFMISKGLLER